MDHTRLRTGELIAGVAGVALLIIMFAFGWFGLPDTISGPGGVEVDLEEFAAASGEDTTANAWQAFGIIDLILLLTVIVSVGLAAATATARNVSLPVAASALTAGLGILSAALILFRIISPPDGGAPSGIDLDIGREIGVYLGFVAAAAIAYGGWRSMQEEGTTFAGEADRIGDRDTPGDRGTGSDAPPPPPPSDRGTGSDAPPPPPPPPRP